MACFASEAELKAFLGKLDADYAEYASALWHEGIKTPRQLANFTEPHYLACGVRRGTLMTLKQELIQQVSCWLATLCICVLAGWNVATCKICS